MNQNIPQDRKQPANKWKKIEEIKADKIMRFDLLVSDLLFQQYIKGGNHLIFNGRLLHAGPAQEWNKGAGLFWAGTPTGW